MRKLITFTLITVFASVTFSMLGSKVYASTPDWQAGNIISDAIFTNKTTMSVAAIQSFLDSKVASCDTNGLQNSELGGPDINGDGRVQRWEYGKTYYNQTTFPCLKDYKIADGRSSAQVIYDISQKYSINPQVFLVLLQKEQSLVTDTWPLSIQYRSAAGYGCPDTAPCDSQYYGLLNQLDWAGKMFRAIINNSPTWYTPYILGNNFIGYNPNRDACGGSTVNIVNRSTQALYNYTPYQPNQGALDAGWGTAYCGAYGNLRFYQYFTSWFGSTRGGELFSYDIVMNSPITLTPVDPRAGDAVTVTLNVKNVSAGTINYNGTLLQCRLGTDTNCDSAMKAGGSIAPGATQSLSYTITAPAAGAMTLKPVLLSTSGAWYRFAPSANYASDKSINIPQLRALGPLSYTPNHPNVGETIRFSVPIVNNGTRPLTLSTSLIQCRINNVTNCDTPPGGTDIIPAGASRVYDYEIPVLVAGNYTFNALYNFDGRWFKYIYLDTPTYVSTTDITTGNTLSVSDSGLIANQPFQVNYSLSNNGPGAVTIDSSITQCRFNTAVNCDPSSKPQTTLQSGASTTITDSFKATSPGSYVFVPYYLIGGEYHTPRVAKALGATVRAYNADMRISDFTMNNPAIGDPLNVSYTVKNNGTETAYYQDGVLQCRINGSNCDSPYSGQIEIAPGASRTFSHQIVAKVSSGTYNLTPYFMQDGKWNIYKNIDGSNFSQKSLTVSRVQPNLSINAPIILSNQSPRTGDDITAQYTITNNGTTSLNISNWLTQCRINNSVNCDNTWGAGFSISSGQSIALTTTHRISQPGSYRLIPYFNYDSVWYTYSGNSATNLTVQ